MTLQPTQGSQRDRKPRRRWQSLAAVFAVLAAVAGFLGFSVTQANAAQVITCNITWTQNWSTPVGVTPKTTTFSVDRAHSKIWSCSGDPHLNSGINAGNAFQAGSAPTSASCLAGVYANSGSPQVSFWNASSGPTTSNYTWAEPSLADLVNGSKTIAASYTSGRYQGGTIAIVVAGTQPANALAACMSPSGLSSLTVTGVMTIVVP
ncbi:hypothetical protein [Streptomyces noursei]|uniref:hypothetical protein n=1 Tax=Streptomyces noursei TaxID=1971 RepID=UPI0037F4BB27